MKSGKTSLPLILLLILFNTHIKDIFAQKYKSGTLSFSFTVSTADIKERITDLSDPATLYLNLVNSEGNLVYTHHKFSVSREGDQYVTGSIELEAGDYTLEDFSVLNEAGETILLTPKKGTEFANLVATSMPLSFSVSSKNKTEVALQVIATDDGEAPQFGYANFSLNTINHDFEVLLDTLEYPKALFWTEGNLYFTETAGRNTSFGKRLTLNNYDLFSNRLTTLKDTLENSDALVVIGDEIILSSYHSVIPGEQGKVSVFDITTHAESHLLDIEIATRDMCIDENDNIYLLGSSDQASANSLYKFSNRDFTAPEVLLTGLGRTWTITCHESLIYFSDHDNIYKYDQKNDPEIIASKKGVLGMAVTDNYLYYSEYFYNNVGRIHLTTQKDEVLFDSIIKPGALTIDRTHNILYLLTLGTRTNKYKDSQLIRVGQIN